MDSYGTYQPATTATAAQKVCSRSEQSCEPMAAMPGRYAGVYCTLWCAMAATAAQKVCSLSEACEPMRGMPAECADGYST